MYICILASLPDDNDIPYDPSAYMNGYRWKQHLVGPKDVEKQIRDLMDEGVEVFINLCDGTPDDALSGISLVHALEKYNAAFTGADSKFFDPTRDEMKNAARRVSEDTTAPEFSLFLNYTGLDRYNRQGVVFIFDPKTKRLHYDGAA
jgi:hypothetical protein